VAGALEMMRGYLIDLEAVAHAAEDALQYLPYVPRPSPEPGQEDAPYTDQQLGLGRLQAMVAATSSASRILLKEFDRLLETVQAERKAKYGIDPRTGSSRASEDWNPSFLLPARLDSLSEPS
jgi:hypothetical protein